MKSVLFSIIFLTSVHSFAKNTWKIIGDNNLVAVNAEATNIPFRYRNIVDAFGIIQVGCTATHIGNGYVLTAGHCFWASDKLKRNQSCGEDYNVKWGYREGAEVYLTSKCVELIAAQMNDKYDFAIFKVYPVPPVSIPVNLNDLSKYKTKLTIFSHPNEYPLRWSKSCYLKRTISFGFETTVLQHQCDTQPGSSGATILDAETLEVVGIHDGGISSGVSGMNYGTFISTSPLRKILVSLGF